MNDSMSPQDRSRAMLALQLKLQQGASEEEAIELLVSRGMPADEAQRALQSLVQKSVAEDRTKGAWWVAFGVICLLLAAPFVWANFAWAEAGGSFRVFRFTTCLPVGLVLSGVVLLLRGIGALTARGYTADPD